MEVNQEGRQVIRIPLATGTTDPRDGLVPAASRQRDFRLTNCYVETTGPKKMLCPRKVVQGLGLAVPTNPTGLTVATNFLAGGVTEPSIMVASANALKVFSYNIGGSITTFNFAIVANTRTAFGFGAFSSGPKVMVVPVTGTTTAYQYDVSANTNTAVVLPIIPVHGVASLDGYFFVMDSKGYIYNSALQDGTSWPALNFLQASIVSGRGMAIANHLNYVVALLDRSVEFFYDAGNATGSVLSKVENATQQIGCASGESVVDIIGNLVWIAQGKDGGRFVAMMASDGVGITRVSNQQVDRYLDQKLLLGVQARGFRYAGHLFYAFDISGDVETLVYDITEKEWMVWNTIDASGAQTSFAEKFSSLLDQPNLGSAQIITVGVLTAQVGSLTEGYTEQVNGTTKAVSAKCQLELLDFGMKWQKFSPRAAPIGDYGSFSVDLSWSDDDYNSWSAARTINMLQQRPETRNLGPFYRRAYRLVWQGTDGSSSRLEALELEVDFGLGS